MDAVIRKSYKKHFVIAGAIAGFALLLVLAFWVWMPRGLQVSAGEVRIASVENGIFLDNMVVRASATPLNSVILDAVDSGRVEEIFVRDGSVVAKGAPLFRLSNSQRQIDLLARQSDQATQISNISNLRAALEMTISERERRLADLTFNVQQLEKKYARSKQLFERGFISSAGIEEVSDTLEQARHTLSQEKIRASEEMKIKREGIQQMEQATARLTSGLSILNSNIAALTVRAPEAGRLTGFGLQVGEAVAPGQHIGRIDDPERFKLSAQVDEYYLNRLSIGQKGKAQLNDQFFDIEVGRIFPQISKGQFTIELVFTEDQSHQLKSLSPGQGLDAQIALGYPKPALVLPLDAFMNDSAGAWVYAVDANGKFAERRGIKIGRRSNSQIEILNGLKAGEKVIVSSYAGFGQAARLQLH